MSLDDAARRNLDTWRGAADAAEVGAPHGPALRAAASTSSIGTNVREDKLAHYAQRNPPEVVATFAFIEAVRGTAVAEDVAVQPEWGPRREALETALDAHRTAVYGTLDLPDQTGDLRYGEYRLVYLPTASERPVLVLPHNSASGYAATGTVNVARLEREVVAWEGRGDLAVTTLLGRSSPDPSTWPELLASEDPASPVQADLVEVVSRDGTRPLTEVSEVRVDAAYLRARSERYLLALATGPTTMEAGDVDFGVIDSRLRGKLRSVP